MATIILQVGWAVSLMGRPLMGHAARRAATGRLLHMLGRVAQRAGVAAQARPIGSCRARHDPWLFGPCHAWAMPNFTCRVLTHLARPGSIGLCHTYTIRGLEFDPTDSHFFDCTGNRSPVNRAVPVRPATR
jgi:hypothetical protein